MRGELPATCHPATRGPGNARKHAHTLRAGLCRLLGIDHIGGRLQQQLRQGHQLQTRGWGRGGDL